MNLTTFTNILTMMFCTAVLVQSVRMMRALRDVKGEAFGDMVIALDKSTSQARVVLGELRETLRVDCAANAKVIASGVAMREELTVMAGIADAVAERIVEAVGKTNTAPAKSAAVKAAPAKAAPAKPAAGKTASPKPRERKPLAPAEQAA